MFNFFKRRTEKKYQRNFEAGLARRLTKWIFSTLGSYDDEVKGSWLDMAQNARDLEKNSDIVRRYLSLLTTNVVGPEGFTLEAKFKNDKGELLEKANREIEREWKRFCEAGNCEVTGQFTFIEVGRLVLSSVARDGDVFIRYLYGKEFNDFGFTLKGIDATLCDPDYDDEEKKIRMGVELDEWGRKKAFHFKSEKFDSGIYENKRVRVSAKNCLHLFRPDRFQQTRGISWIRSPNIKKLVKYFKAELTAATVAACKMLFLIKKTDKYSPIVKGEEKIDYDAFPVEAHEGGIEVLPDNYDVREWSPNSPNSNFPDFVRSELQMIASGLSVSYASLSGDLSRTSYSSARVGLLEERGTYKVLMKWMKDHFILPIYRAWLKAAVMNGAIKNVNFADINRYLTPEIIGRTFDWVDPLKDMAAYKTAVEERFKSRSQVTKEIGGRFYEDVIDDVEKEILLEKRLEERTGISLVTKEEKNKDKEEQYVDDEEENVYAHAS